MKTNVFEAKNDLLICFGDTHIGSVGTDLKALQSMISYAKKSKAHVIGLGDWADAIITTDKRFDIASVDPDFLDENLIQNQYDYIEKLLRPIKNQIIGLHEGNHDYKIRKHCHIDEVNQLCKNLGVPYLGYSALTRMCFKRSSRSNSFVIYSTHGSQGGRSTGPKVNNMESLCSSYQSDLFLMGHTHSLFTTSTSQVYLSQNNTVAYKTLHFGNTGTFLRGIKQDTSSYGEEKGYRPNTIGYLVYKFDPETHTIEGKKVIL